jgi:hypothetical protein
VKMAGGCVDSWAGSNEITGKCIEPRLSSKKFSHYACCKVLSHPCSFMISRSDVLGVYSVSRGEFAST